MAERLERRLLLACSNVDITTMPKQILQDGLAQLDQWADTVDQYAALAQSLPVIGETVGNALDMSNVLHEQLTQKVNSFFDNDPTPTTNELVSFLQGLGTAPGVNPSISIDTGANGVSGGLCVLNEISFTLGFHANRLLPDIHPSLGPRGDAMGIAFDSTINANAALDLSFTFGVNLTAGNSVANAFFVRVNDFHAGASAAGSASGGMNLGFFDATMNGSFNLNANLAVSLNNGGTVTLGQLQTTPLATLLNITPSGSANANINVTTQAMGGLLAATGTVGFNTATPFTPPDVSFSAGLSEVKNFTNLSSFSLVGLLDQISGLLGDLSTTSVLNAAVNLAQNTRLGDVLHLDQLIGNKLLDGLTSGQGSGLGFDSTQSFITAAIAALGGAATVAPGYNPATHELTYTFHYVPLNFAPQLRPFGVSFDLSPVANLSASSNLTVNAQAELNLLVGIKITPVEATLAATAPAPANGRLVAGDAVFQLTAGSTGSPVTVTVTKASTADNTTAANLIADINTALATAGLATSVRAELGANQAIQLIGGSDGFVGDLTLVAGAGNPALTELHFLNNDHQIDTIARHAFIEQDTNSGKPLLSASASVTPTGINASATMGGMLGIQIVNGSGNANAAVSLQLKNQTGQPPGRVTVSDLFSAIATGDVSTIIANSTTCGAVHAILPLQATGNLLGALQGNPRLTIDSEDACSGLSIQFPDASGLLNFRGLNFGIILNALNLLLGFFRSANGNGAPLHFKLPAVNISIPDLLGFINRLAARIGSFSLSLPDLGHLSAALMGAFDLSLADLTFPDNLKTIKVHLNYKESDSKQLPFNFDLGAFGVPSVGNLLEASGSGQLDAIGSYDLALDLGIDLTDPLNPRPFLYDSTNFHADARVSGSNINFSTALGPLGVYVENASVNVDADGNAGTATDRASLDLALTDNDADHKIYLSDISLDNAHVSVHGQAHANVPIYFPLQTTHLGDIVFAVTDLGDISNTTTLTTPDFAATFSNFDFLTNLNVVLDSLDYVLTKLEDAIRQGALGKRLPIVGDNLDEAADFIEKLRVNIRAYLTERFDSQPKSPDVIRLALYDALGPGGLNILKDKTSDNQVMLDDLGMTLSDLNGDGQQDDQLEFDFKLGQALTLLSTPVDFEIGLPALNLQTTGNVEVMLDWSWNVKFGINREIGLYFDTGAADELQVELEARIPDLKATGQLFFLQVDVSDEDADSNPNNDGLDADGDGRLPSALLATLKVDLKDPLDSDGQHKLTYDDLIHASLSEVVSARINGTADVHLDLLVSFGGDARFPSIGAQLDIHWPFVNDSSFQGSAPSVAFNHVTLNVGEWIDDFVDPIVQRVRKFTEPLDGVREFLTSPTPIISKFGLNYTPLQLAKLFGFLHGDFIQSVLDIIDIVNSVPISSDNLIVPMGSFDLAGIDLRNAGAPLTPNVTQVVDPKLQLGNLNAAPELAFVGALDDAGLSFPIFSNPTTLFGLLLGKDVDLFKWDMPDLELRIPFNLPFGPIIPPLPIMGFFSASMVGQTNLAFGFDTHGLRKYLDTRDFHDIFSGFYIDDLDSGGKDKPEATLGGSVTAGLSLKAGIASASIEGGIFAGVNLDLVDPNKDGRVHLDEFLENVDRGFTCTFNTTGDIHASLHAELTSIIGIHKSRDIPLQQFANFNINKENQCYPDRFAGGAPPPPGSSDAAPAVAAQESSNDDFQHATDIGAGPGLHLDWLALEQANDNDWLKFDLLHPDSIDVDIRYSHSLGNVDLEVYNSSNVLLGASATDRDRDVVSLQNLPAGTYYAHIHGDAQNEYKFDVDPGTTSTTRVIYVNPSSADPNHPYSYYTYRPGNDAYDGLSPDRPKTSLQNVLDTYDLGPNDLIVLDYGIHDVGGIITPADEGATYAGAMSGGFVSGVIIDGADNNLFYHVGVGGPGGTGILIQGDAVNNTIRRPVFGNATVGIWVNTDKPNSITDGISSGGGGTGINLSDGAISIVSGNEISGKTTGIYTQSKVAQIYGNKIHNNDVGIIADGAIIGPNNPAPFGTPGGLAPNELYNNTTGILIPAISTGAIIRFNTLHDNATGIEARANNSTIIANDVHDNTVGIKGDDLVGPGSWESNLSNLIHNNTTGIWSNAGGEFRFNRIYANATGARTDGGLIHHNLIYGSTAHGVLADAAKTSQIISNTIYSAAGGDGIHLGNFSHGVSIRNNIVFMTAGTDLYVEASSEDYQSDYNNLYATGSAMVAHQGKDFADLYDWQTEAESDVHSIGATSLAPTLDDPRFANIAGNDFHLLAGSTSIDAGDPASAFSLEPNSNGGRIDLGAYGNTPGATASAAAWIDITYPNFYTDLDPARNYPISWRTFNITGNIDIDLYQEGVGKIKDIGVVAASAGSTIWTPGSFAIAGNNTSRYRIRLTSVANPSIIEDSREAFSIPVIGTSFFVDDNSNANDQYTPAATGNNRNTGTIATQPKSVIRSLLLSYAMNSTQTVFVDSGNYVHAINTNLRGVASSAEPRMQTVNGTTFTGSTPTIRPVIDRMNQNEGATNLHLIGAVNIKMRNLILTDADTGLLIENNADSATLSGLSVNNNHTGIFVDSLLASLTNSDVYNNTGIGVALRNVGAASVNTVRAHNNFTGIDVINPLAAAATIGDPAVPFENLPDPRLGNVVNNNLADGIFASGNVLVVGSSSFLNGEAGIQLDDGADATRNVVRQNARGIAAFGSSSDITENRVYANGGSGIEASYSSNLVRNVVYSNGLYGIHTKDFSGLIDHNLVYASASESIRVEGPGLNPRLINNTVYEPCAQDPDPVSTQVRTAWDWVATLQQSSPLLNASVPLSGVGTILYSPPVGQNTGGTFQLGSGGGFNATTTDPVPQGDLYQIDTELISLTLTSLMSGEVPGLGQVDVRLSTDPPGLPGQDGTGLLGIYYDNGGDTSEGGGSGAFANQTGKVVTRIDPNIDFDFGEGSPAPGIGPETHSVQWLGQIKPRYSENYTFCMASDDGAFLDIGTTRVVNDPSYHGKAQFPNANACGSIALTAGVKYDLRMMFFEYGGGSGATLSWQSPSQPLEIVPQSAFYPKEYAAPPANGVFDLQTSVSTPYGADLFWSDVNSDAIGYVVMRSTSGQSGSFYEVARVAGHTYQDSYFPGGNGYWYQIRPFNTPGMGPASNVAFASPFSPQILSGQGISARYYNNPDWAGVPSLTRIEPQINTNWGGGSPDPSINSDLFSVRYTGRLTAPQTGLYTFITNTDDGSAVWLGGIQIIDDLNLHGPVDVVSPIQAGLTAGLSYSLRFDYFEAFGGASATLSWIRPDGVREVIPPSQFIANMAVPLASTLTASDVTPQSVTLSWNDRPNELAYTIERDISPSFSSTTVELATLPMNATNLTVTFTDSTVTPNTTYYYRVRGINFDGRGAYSNVFSVHTPAFTLPTAPLALRGAARPGQINLRWENVATEKGYRVYRKQGAGGLYQQIGGDIGQDVISYADKDATLVSGQTYFYKVLAFNDAGQSAFSNEIQIVAGGAGGIGLRGTYYDNKDFTARTAQRIDPTVNFDFGNGAPAGGMGADNFSVVWEGQVQAEYNEPYTFNVETDDGMRLYVDNTLVIDSFIDQAPTVHEGSIQLTTGKHDIRLEYYENTVGAVARLRWSSPSTPLETIPQSLLFPAPLQNIGRILVTNDGGTISGISEFDLYVDFVMPTRDLVLMHNVPMHVESSFSGLNPFNVLQTALQFTNQGTTPTLQDQYGHPWGLWTQVSANYNPRQLPPPQTHGTKCVEIGVHILNNVSKAFLRNNIIYVEGHKNNPPAANSHDIVVEPDSTARWNSEFNELTTRYGNIGRFGGLEAGDLAAWQGVTNDDRHSREDDIDGIFVDPDGGDGKLGFDSVGATDGRDDNFHLLSPMGQIIQGAHAPVEDLNGTFAPELLQLIFDPQPFAPNLSPSIDSGDPSSAFDLEPNTNGRPAPNNGSNGQWINQGAYGNTTQASISPTKYVYEANPIGFEKLVPGRQINIQWRTYDAAPTVNIDLLGGATPTVIAAGAPNNGSFIWTIPAGLLALDTYSIRVTRTNGGWAGSTKFPIAIGPDSVAPKITTSTPLIVDDSLSTNASITSIRLNFTENLQMPSASAAANYELRSAGANGLFGDGDDVVFGFTSRTYTDANLNTGDAANVVLFRAIPLTQGLYRLTAFATPVTGLRDASGIQLDGDANGVAGGNYVRTFTIDTTPPLINSITGVSSFTNTAPTNLVINFSEPVLGLGLSDLRLTRNSGSNILTGEQTLTHSADYRSWALGNVSSLMEEEGLYFLSVTSGGSTIADIAGNPLIVPASLSWTMDKTSPTATIGPIVPNTRAGGVSSLDIQFNEIVTDFALSKVTLLRNGVPLSTSSLTLNTTDNIHFTINNLSALTNVEGTYTLTVGPSIHDQAGNILVTSVESFIVTPAPPAASIVAITPNPRNTAIDAITINFNKQVSGFDLSDLSLTRNGGANLLSGSAVLSTQNNMLWTLSNLSSLTTPAGSYTLTLTAAGSGIVDMAATALLGNASGSWINDQTAPTLTISSISTPRIDGLDHLDLQFSEFVSAFALGSISLTRNGIPVSLANATLSTTDNISWQLGNLLDLSTPQGTYAISIDPVLSGAKDLAGNPLASGASATWVVTQTTIPAAANDQYYLRVHGLNSIQVYHNRPAVGSPDFTLPRSATALRFITGGGNDSLTLDWVTGNPIPPGGIFFDGGAQPAGGADSLTLIGNGASAGTYRPSGSQNGSGSIVVEGNTLTFAGLEPVNASAFPTFTLITPNPNDALNVTTISGGGAKISGTSGGVGFEELNVFSASTLILDTATNDAGGGNDSISIPAGLPAGLLLQLTTGTGSNFLAINAGTAAIWATDIAALAVSAANSATINLTATQHLKSLTLSGSAHANAAPGGAIVLRTNAISITGAAQLDLADNDMIIQGSGGAATGSEFTQLVTLIRSGAIFSSTAAVNPLRNTSLAAVLNNNGAGSPLHATFFGQSVDDNSMLVKYTYKGDADLNGIVNADDYAHIDAGFATHAHGYENGDFDLSGAINSDDFFYIDLAFSTQGSTLGDVITAIAPRPSAYALEKSVKLLRNPHRAAVSKRHHHNRPRQNPRTPLMRPGLQLT